MSKQFRKELHEWAWRLFNGPGNPPPLPREAGSQPASSGPVSTRGQDGQAQMSLPEQAETLPVVAEVRSGDLPVGSRVRIVDGVAQAADNDTSLQAGVLLGYADPNKSSAQIHTLDTFLGPDRVHQLRVWQRASIQYQNAARSAIRQALDRLARLARQYGPEGSRVDHREEEGRRVFGAPLPPLQYQVGWVAPGPVYVPREEPEPGVRRRILRRGKRDFRRESSD